MKQLHFKVHMCIYRPICALLHNIPHATCKCFSAWVVKIVTLFLRVTFRIVTVIKRMLGSVWLLVCWLAATVIHQQVYSASLSMDRKLPISSRLDFATFIMCACNVLSTAPVGTWVQINWTELFSLTFLQGHKKLIFVSTLYYECGSLCGHHNSFNHLIFTLDYVFNI